MGRRRYRKLWTDATQHLAQAIHFSAMEVWRAYDRRTNIAADPDPAIIDQLIHSGRAEIGEPDA